MNTENVALLEDTLKIMNRGYYKADGKKLVGKKVKLKLSRAEMETARVFLPDEVRKISERMEGRMADERNPATCYNCENVDSFELARKRYKENSQTILVLNMANPVNPGGGVRRGARAQEEDLCRKSSLLLSLEGEQARSYYSYNQSLDTYMGSDAVIFSPKVEVIRDENNRLLEESFVVAVLTCAAPMVTYGKEGMGEREYQEMVYDRINGMLKCAAYLGYRYLVLGAWGCGAFRNDPQVISNLFYQALDRTNVFESVDFAVLDRSEKQNNFKAFSRNFGLSNFNNASGTEEV